MFLTHPSTDASKASVDTLYGYAGQALQGVEQLAALNLQTLKTVLAEASQTSQAVLSTTQIDELVKLQAAALQAAPEKAIAYGRHLSEIFSSAFAEQRSAFEAQLVDTQNQFLAALTGSLKNLPGSEGTIALVGSAVAAANNAYEGVSKVHKQVSDAVDANVSKLTETALVTTRATAAANGS